MRRAALCGVLLAACGLTAAMPGPAAAIERATFVSVTGVDRNNCILASPCRTLKFAHENTAPGGVITILGPGAFSPLAITKSLTIISRGGAVIQNTFPNCGTGFTGAAICIVAGATGIVELDGLTIEVTPEQAGIHFRDGAALRLRNCVLRKFDKTGVGLLFAPANAAALSVDNCNIAGAESGIVVRPRTGVALTADLTGVLLEDNVKGLELGFTGTAGGSIKLRMLRNVVAGGKAGILATVTSGKRGTIDAIVQRSAIVNNDVGVSASGKVITMRIGGSTITGNRVAAKRGPGAAIFLLPDNMAEGNGDNSTTIRRSARNL